MSNGVLTSQLDALLSELVTNANNLLEVLTKENHALTESIVDTIQECVKQKHRLVTVLTQKDQLFRHTINKKEAPVTAIAEFLDQLESNDDSLKIKWLDYIKNLQRCDALNQDNASLTNISMHRTNKLIDFLYNSIGEETEKTYTAQGVAVSNNNAGILAKA